MLEKVFLASLTKIILKNRFLMILASAYPTAAAAESGAFIVGIARCMTESRCCSVRKFKKSRPLYNYIWIVTMLECIIKKNKGKFILLHTYMLSKIMRL